MTSVLEHLSYEDRLRKLELFSIEQTRFWGHLIVAFQYFKGVYNKDGERVLFRACRKRTVMFLIGKRVDLGWTKGRLLFIF